MTSEGVSESICPMSNMCPQTYGHIKRTIREKPRKTRYFKG